MNDRINDTALPREGMMAVVRNRRALVTGVQPFDADEGGRLHLVEVEYTDGLGSETDQLLWEVEPSTQVLEPSALPRVDATPPMVAEEYDAMVRAARWAALTPSLPFSGLSEDRPPLAAPLFGAINPEAYQLVPVLRALEMPRVALLLADAVGLGKTIQAGMILRELMLRRRIRRILILCPASLRTQWRDEMNEKFALPFDVIDRPHTLRLQRELGIDANPWRVHERAIASYHYLKQADVLEQFRSTAEPGADGRLKWDLLIVDEAHNCAPASFGPDSDLSKLLQRISPWFEHRLFLTATPHNGHTRSFSGLLEALDPVRFTRKSQLDEEDRRRVGETVVRRLKSEINGCYQNRGEPPRFSDRIVDALPVLRFGAAERAASEAFHDFRRALRKASATASPADRTAVAFAVEVLQKRLLSGPWAFGQSWLQLLEGLDEPAAAADAPDPAFPASAAGLSRLRAAHAEDVDDDAERESRYRQTARSVGAWLRAWRTAVASELAAVTAAVENLGIGRIEPGLDPARRRKAVADAAAHARADARLKQLKAFIDERLRVDGEWRSDERLVIFTEYLATLDYLYARLAARYGDDDRLLAFYGGMTDDERDAVKRAFNDPASRARILIATDAAGEGLNLQRSCRLLLHWDIPWNPARMEQRNGRLDRHGQERDVLIFHFDATDDTSLTFLGKVLRKRSQTREDLVVTDDIFSRALLGHFEHDEDPEASEARLDRIIDDVRRRKGDVENELPEAAPLPGDDDRRRLEEMKAELDLSPDTLRETLETAMAVQAGRPRLRADGPGRDRFVPPVPGMWQEIVDHTLRHGDATGPMMALVFDPETYVLNRSGRPVFLPEPDSRLLHLGHALYHRVMSVFARYRFPGGPAGATRWIARTGEIPEGCEALVLLTVEELAVNELREPCHHWVRTMAFPVSAGSLGASLPHRPVAEWGGSRCLPDTNRAKNIFDDIESDLAARVRDCRGRLTDSLKVRLTEAGKLVKDREKKRLARRRAELEKAVRETQIERLRQEAEELRERARQRHLFAEIDEELARRIADLDAEIGLRRSHYESVMQLLAAEETRTLERILPARYSLRGEAQVYPLAVEIRLPEDRA
ncbi:MAG TPA: DISARM system SNF2-like helicase DrmD [Candidatus Ozemobacteraceae bacterium]|nr:DISARM system SNF2-like helicase DrmD [Candidatus Ozemobacteraceae bacterium]